MLNQRDKEGELNENEVLQTNLYQYITDLKVKAHLRQTIKTVKQDCKISTTPLSDSGNNQLMSY